ncbi:hypothetical protein [Companilactobacillus mishanensis]|uniref:Uncharacterized protein n=1 Tax=Companilactobacillus mishanensis TaxID=2486008 RepID=A0ABW9P9N2_9LACO|nr:hypothetical protein [Companilactobacillus mishanensis]MQS45752.1 hypothetical protein [Companilactobacillus mishanensis]
MEKIKSIFKYGISLSFKQYISIVSILGTWVILQVTIPNLINIFKTIALSGFAYMSIGEFLKLFIRDILWILALIVNDIFYPWTKDWFCNLPLVERLYRGHQRWLQSFKTSVGNSVSTYKNTNYDVKSFYNVKQGTSGSLTADYAYSTKSRDSKINNTLFRIFREAALWMVRFFLLFGIWFISFVLGFIAVPVILGRTENIGNTGNAQNN